MRRGLCAPSTSLPQTYQVAVIHYGEAITVEKYSLSGENDLDIPLEIGRDSEKVVVVVAGTTPYTRQKTPYRFEIAP